MGEIRMTEERKARDHAGLFFGVRRNAERALSQFDLLTTRPTARPMPQVRQYPPFQCATRAGQDPPQ